MPYHPRMETNLAASFITTRCRNSELWFAGNTPGLEEAILGHFARVADRYHVEIYGLAIVGNHVHTLGYFPELNRSSFMRDLNSCIARAVPRHVANYNGGKLWARRYSAEIVPFDDLERQFFYTVLQPVNDGMVEKLSEYPFYNCFHDAIWCRTRTYKVIRWADFHAAQRSGLDVSPSDYADTVTLSFKRLPGYDKLSAREYAVMMNKKLEEYRQEILKRRITEGKTEFMGRERLLNMIPGSLPVKTKTSERDSFRPRVLSKDPERYRWWIEWYFDRYWTFKAASKRFIAGELGVEFPPGMYRPPLGPVATPT